MHMLLEEHCAHMAEDLAMTGVLRMHMEPEQENIQAGAGNRGVDSAHFIIVFVVAGHAGHVSSADKQIAWPWMHNLS